MGTELTIQSRDTQYIARVSVGGKDSTKMLEVIVSRGLPLDRITSTTVWATDTIRGEHPKMVEFEPSFDEFVWRKYRIEVEHLCAMRDGKKVTYEQMFYHVPERRAEKCGGGAANSRERSSASRPCGGLGARNPSKYQGLPTGFPLQRGPWCQKLKHIWVPGIHQPKGTMVPEAQDRVLEGPTPRGGTNIVEYLGIAADEPKRFGQLSDRKRAPLVEFGIEEGLCGLYCQYEGILAPVYETGCRDGCWFCHNQGVNQLRLLRKEYPELWALLLKWDTDSPVYFKPGKPDKSGKPTSRTVHDYDRRFQMEDEGLLIPGDRRFRWEMLDGEFQIRMF